MDKPYHLPITLLIASTMGVHQELSFQTRLPPQRISKEECVVQLRVRDGAMLSCEIKKASGGPILFQEEQAIDALKPLGMLEWHRALPPAYQAEEAYEQRPIVRKSGSPPSPTLEQRLVRRRLNVEFPTLDHAHRRVLLLADGTRSVHQIATLLGKSQGEILTLLQALQDQNLITF